MCKRTNFMNSTNPNKNNQPPPAAQAAAPSLEERLKKLKSLKEAGLLDDQEYAAKRAELLKEL